MKISGIILITVLAVVAADFYSSRYDDFDVQPMLENPRVLVSYTNCFLDEGPCTPDAKDFKKVIPEALETTCEKCTPKQKELIRAVVRAVMQQHPAAWDQLTDKYDSEKKYKEAFDKFLAGKD